MEDQERPQAQLPKRVSLPTELVNEVLSVFSQMPYNQVAAIITKVQQSVQPIPDGPEPGEPELVPTDPA